MAAADVIAGRDDSCGSGSDRIWGKSRFRVSLREPVRKSKLVRYPVIELYLVR
jgi:hypothetical protein